MEHEESMGSLQKTGVADLRQERQMREVYRIPYVGQPEEGLLRAAPRAWLGHWYPVPQGTYQPQTYGQLLRTPYGLYVRMVCQESSPMAEQRMPNCPVCTDSCMEFFLNPDSENDTFLNFEVNARGAMLMGLNVCGAFRCLDPALQTGCFPAAYVDEEKGEWEIRLCIPDSLLRRFFPAYDPGETRRMRGNFYKCGDAAPIPHYGSWNYVSRDPIDFHCPECFGDLLVG